MFVAPLAQRLDGCPRPAYEDKVPSRQPASCRRYKPAEPRNSYVPVPTGLLAAAGSDCL
jgi:hypothetical protein